MYSEKIKQVVNEYSDKPVKLSLSKELKPILYAETSWIDSLYSSEVLTRTRMYLVANNITSLEQIKCPMCNNPRKINKTDYALGFREFCSDACSKKSRKIENKHNVSKEWLYEQRVINKRTMSDIAEELGLDEHNVCAMCKRFDFPVFNLSSLDSKIVSVLDNKEWLYEQYIVQNKCADKIADEIGGTSKHSVLKYLKMHNIQIKEPNSYQREAKPSAESLEVVEFIEGLGFECTLDRKDILKDNREIDITIEDKKFCIEYNGLYSHIFRPNEKNESAKKGQTYHLSKTTKASLAGYKLIHIFGDDWNHKKDIVKSIIANKLGKSEKVFYARDCEIRSVGKNQKNKFLRENHLQGDTGSKFNYGLFLGDELLGLMTFGVSRYNKDVSWELVRFCILKNVSVVGGFSKLLKHFRKNHSGSIVSYADRCISDGWVYEKNGFTLISINRPNYWYVDIGSNLKKNRVQFMKKRIAPNDPRPEWQIVEEDYGMYRMWNCGTLTYVLD